jgi:hypothetical protein
LSFVKLDDERDFKIVLDNSILIDGEDIIVDYTSIGTALGETVETKDEIKITFTEDE